MSATTPQQVRNRGLKSAMMAVRMGFTIAIAIGLARILGFWLSEWVLLGHLLAGLLVLGGIWTAVVKLAGQRKAGWLLWVAGIMLLAGAALGMGAAFGKNPPQYHWMAMVLATALGEIGAAKAQR